MNADVSIRLMLEPGHPSQGEMKLRISPDAAEQLTALIRDEGLTCTPLYEFSISDVTSLAAFIVGGIGTGAAALNGLAHALTAFFHRNDGKAIELYEGGQLKTLTGMSVEEARAMLDTIAERQRQIDRDWEEQHLGRRPSPSTAAVDRDL